MMSYFPIFKGQQFFYVDPVGSFGKFLFNKTEEVLFELFGGGSGGEGYSEFIIVEFFLEEDREEIYNSLEFGGVLGKKQNSCIEL